MLVGGTGCGKKAVAAALAERGGRPVLSMDSMKVYRGMDIGTDKPDAELQARVPFGLIDLEAHSSAFSVGRWARAADAAVRAAGRGALFVGGTPLYLRALLSGLCDAPPADAALRRQLEALWEAQGEAAVRAQLAAGDPESEARLSPRDRKRLLRALEVLRLTGRPLAAWQREHTRPIVPGGFVVVGLRRARQDEHARAARRVDRMLARGLLAEVDALAAQAPFAREPGRAIGYAEVLALRAGRLAGDALRERIVVRTRQLLRKQRLFLASFPEIRWVDVGADDSIESLALRVTRLAGD